uniref:Nicotinate phosphoribosyltransferase n=2 Tax=Canis lupus familiaris TaxID=9615 RepID=A0A8I3P074_CANLF
MPTWGRFEAPPRTCPFPPALQRQSPVPAGGGRSRERTRPCGGRGGSAPEPGGGAGTRGRGGGRSPSQRPRAGVGVRGAGPGRGFESRAGARWRRSRTPRRARRPGRCSPTCTRPPWRWATGARAGRGSRPSSSSSSAAARSAAPSPWRPGSATACASCAPSAFGTQVARPRPRPSPPAPVPRRLDETPPAPRRPPSPGRASREPEASGSGPDASCAGSSGEGLCPPRRAVSGLGAAPRHGPRVLRAPSCPRLLGCDGAGPARGLPRLPQRAVVAGVGAAPGGAAAGDAPPLPGQLRQMLAPAASPGPKVDLTARVEAWLDGVCAHLGLGVQEPHRGERAAFVAYALAFPQAFQGLLDTYSVQRSGLPNFLAVALALGELGYRAVGIRLDSGDLLQQAQEIRGVFRTVSARFQMPWLESISIAVSNNIDEKELARLAQEGSEVNVIGIGTNVVTCPRQPSLGCVYKLVSVGGQPRMKLTEDPEKQTLPGSKAAFRLLGPEGSLLLDVLQLAEEPPPQAGQELRVWPHGAREACTVRPAGVEPLLRLWVQQGQLCEPLPSLAESRAFAQLSLSRLSPEHKRLEWPALYQVALSDKLRALVDRLGAGGSS